MNTIQCKRQKQQQQQQQQKKQLVAHGQYCQLQDKNSRVISKNM